MMDLALCRRCVFHVHILILVRFGLCAGVVVRSSQGAVVCWERVLGYEGREMSG